MRYHKQTAPTVAIRIIPAAALLAIIVTLSMTLGHATHAQAPIVQPPLATGTPSATLTPQNCNPIWNVVPSPNAGASDNFLTSIALLSPSDAWAAGYYTGTGRDLTLTEHWDGTQWSVVSSPNPGTYNNVIRGVTVIAPNDVWAVGDYNNDPAHPTRHLLTMHWDGTQWSVVTNPDPGGNYDNSLNAARAFSSSYVWAVGFYRYTGFDDLRMLWSGVWSVNYTPTVPYGDLYSIDGQTSDDTWTVGGSSYQSGYEQPLTEHLAGGNWSVVPSPSLPNHQTALYGVGMVSTNDVWAVGASDIYAGPHTYIQHWDGTTWSIVTGPDVGKLSGVKALAANDVWAVGSGVFLHWDGATWATITDPVGALLAGIDGLSTSDIWAVGTQNVGGVSRTLIEHYSAGCTTTTPVPSATATGTRTATGTPPLTGTPTATVPSPSSTGTATPPPATNTTTPPPGTGTATAPPGTPTATAAWLSSTDTATPPPGTNTPATATPQATSTSCTIAFSDVPPGSTFYPYVRCLACRSIVQGYGDGTYKPNNPVTRGQASKIISNSAGWSDIIPPGQQTFNDVPPGSTFWLYIERAYLHGAIAGYPCGGSGEPCPGLYFRPANTLTRGQIAKIVSNSAGWSDIIPPGQQTFNDVLPGSTFWVYIERAALHGVVSGYPDGTYRPQNQVTRGQIAKVAANSFFPDCNTPRR